MGGDGRQSQESRLELGYVSAIDSNGRTIWIADAHRDNGKRLVVHADEKLTVFAELESAVRACAERITSDEKEVSPGKEGRATQVRKSFS